MFDDLMDSRAHWLMLNTVSIYNVLWMEIGDEPLVMGFPSGVTGIVDHAWFQYVVDSGNADPDMGRGGKFHNTGYPMDVGYCKELNETIQAEPLAGLDPGPRAVVASLGIEKRKDGKLRVCLCPPRAANLECGVQTRPGWRYAAQRSMNHCQGESAALNKLMAMARSAMERLRDRSTRRRVGTLHIKVDQLNRRMTQLVTAAKHSALPGQEVDKGTQLLLGLKYRELAEHKVLLPFREVEFRNFSQSGEDGILHYIFSLIGPGSRRAVEICAGNGSECNTANLVIHHGWHALLVDGGEQNVRQGRAFFAQRPETRINGPVFARAWIERESVNALLEQYGFTGEVDLLSVDIDGVDYWIWDAITAISPRVVVVEVNLTMSGAPVTVPYKPDFAAQWIPLTDGKTAQADARRAADLRGRGDFYSRFAVYAGASLPAFVKLAKRKGYRLVGTNGIGFNAFFMRDDVGLEQFPEISAESCINPAVNAHSATAVQKLQVYEWQEV